MHYKRNALHFGLAESRVILIGDASHRIWVDIRQSNGGAQKNAAHWVPSVAHEEAQENDRWERDKNTLRARRARNGILAIIKCAIFNTHRQRAKIRALAFVEVFSHFFFIFFHLLWPKSSVTHLRAHARIILN